MGDTWLHNPRPGAPCSIIAEVAQAHDGSLGLAHAFIDAAADAGADAIKFQTHIASAESTPSEPWRKRFSLQDETRYDYWKRMEFSPEQWSGLKEHAHRRGLLFVSSPFSLEAVALLRRVGVDAWKVASGEIASTGMLQQIGGTGQPLLLSTGMSSLEEIDESVNAVRRYGVPLAVLQCSSTYPCPPERVGLNVIGEFRRRYDCAVGLSDHSGAIYAGLAAVALGIEVLEVHITLSREMFGPDVASSLTSAEVRQLTDGVRAIERMRLHPVDKSSLPDDMAELRKIFMKSVVAARQIQEGTVLTERDLTAKKPGTGIPARHLQDLIGRTASRTIERDALVQYSDLEGGAHAS